MTSRFVARGAQLAAMRSPGLRVQGPDGSYVARLDVFGAPAELDWRADDVVILAVKSQDTRARWTSAATPRAATSRERLGPGRVSEQSLLDALAVGS